MRPVSELFHRCRATLNIDVVVHGRTNSFSSFVQSIYAVDMPQHKYRLDKLCCHSGPAGRALDERKPWHMPFVCDSDWAGGSVCSPLTGQHYSGPGMGLELVCNFVSMYPAIMLALNISSETMLPWPVSEIEHDLSGWVCYRWDAEVFHNYATKIMRFDGAAGVFVRDRGTMASAMERYLERRAQYKVMLKDDSYNSTQKSFFKAQEGVSKVLANSFYGTAGPCGPIVSGHGRRQIEVVNKCASSFFKCE